MSREALPIFKSSRYLNDLANALDWLFQANQDSAILFLDQLDLTIDQLTKYPKLGTFCQFDDKQLAEVRVIRAAKLSDFLLYYQPTEESLNLIRLVHGSRDL